MSREEFKIFFVCFGNTCRSPMAEAIFKDMIKKKGLEEKFEVDSAAISELKFHKIAKLSKKI